MDQEIFKEIESEINKLEDRLDNLKLKEKKVQKNEERKLITLEAEHIKKKVDDISKVISGSKDKNDYTEVMAANLTLCMKQLSVLSMSFELIMERTMSSYRT